MNIAIKRSLVKLSVEINKNLDDSMVGTTLAALYMNYCDPVFDSVSDEEFRLAYADLKSFLIHSASMDAENLEKFFQEHGWNEV